MGRVASQTESKANDAWSAPVEQLDPGRADRF